MKSRLTINNDSRSLFAKGGSSHIQPLRQNLTTVSHCSRPEDTGTIFCGIDTDALWQSSGISALICLVLEKHMLVYAWFDVILY